MFFTERIDMISFQTNLYGQVYNHGVNCTASEIKKLLGVFIRIGIFKMPAHKPYWSSKCRLSCVADVISRDRFDELRRYLHFSPNNSVVTDRNDPFYDRFFKIRPLLLGLRNACRNFQNDQFNDVDEQIVPFKGRHNLKVYMKQKAHKWGFKIYSRNSLSGFTHDFKFHDGSKAIPQHSCGFVPGDIVIKLCETMEPFKNYVCCFDNYFNSLELQLTLLTKYGIYSIGTLRKDRTRACIPKSEKELKRDKRGAYDYKIDAISGVIIVRWYDCKIVQLSSTYAGVHPIREIKRYDKAQKKHVMIKEPHIVAEYNRTIGWNRLI